MRFGFVVVVIVHQSEREWRGRCTPQSDSLRPSLSTDLDKNGEEEEILILMFLDKHLEESLQATRPAVGLYLLNIHGAYRNDRKDGPSIA